MRLSLIVAMTPDRVIGRAGGLPWRLSADLQRFKKLTLGHHLLMGRKTYESIGKPLPGRVTLVIRRPESEFRPNLPPDQPLYHTLSSAARSAALEKPDPPPLGLADSLDQAIALAVHDSEAFVVGGGEIYALALAKVDRIYITWVEANASGDAWFPEFALSAWKEIESTTFPADSRNEFPTRFAVYERKS